MSDRFKNDWTDGGIMALNKEFLSGLGIADDAVNSIMAEHGKSIQAEQHKTAAEKTRADSATAALNEANTKLVGYDPDWKTKVETSQANAKAEIEKLNFNYALDKALRDSGARNTKALQALLDVDGLKLSGENIIGLKEQIDTIKKDNGFLFNDDQGQKMNPIPPMIGRQVTSNNPNETVNAALRAAFRNN